MTERVEVAIVGAGPAGAIAALLLARAGRDVVLLDRREFPRPKPCGDCISAGANRLLHELGLLQPILALRPARLESWRLYAPSGAPLEVRFDAACPDSAHAETSLALPRDRLDAALLDEARRAGADVRLGVRVNGVAPDAGRAAVATIDAQHRPVRLDARLVIGADGLRSTVARAIDAYRRKPRLRKLALTAHLTGVRDVDSAGEMHFGDDLCAGVAPVDEVGDLCNITLVAGARHARAVARDKVGFFFAALETFPALRGRIARPAADPTLLASGPFDWPTRRVVSGRVALVGDAAGYYDPMTGQGIHQAVAGAATLARHAAGALRSGSDVTTALRGYARDHARIANAPRLLQRLLETCTATPGRTETLLRRLARAPDAARAVLAATADVAHPAVLLSPRAILSFASPRPLESRT